MDVKLRHLAATPAGRSVRAIAIDAKSVVFDDAAAMGAVADLAVAVLGLDPDVTEFQKRLGVRECVPSLS
jgi:hypothetical protein